MIPKLKEVELFEYLNIMRKQNAIDGIPIDDLRLVLTGNDSGNYKLVNDCIYYMTFCTVFMNAMWNISFC